MPSAQPVLGVAEIFNKTQEGTGGHAKYAKLLWAQQAKDTDACWEQLCSMSHYLMTVPPVSALASDMSILLQEDKDCS